MPRNATVVAQLGQRSFLDHHLAMMGEGRIDLFRQAVRNMLATLRVPDISDDELHDLTLRIGHTGKLQETIELDSLN